MGTRISKRTVEAVEPRSKDVILWDDELRGFGVKVTPKGRRVYAVQYRTRAGRVRKYTIGSHGSPWTADEARQDARRVLGEAAINELRELYLAEGCATKKRSTVYQDKNRIAHHVCPLLGARPVRDVTRADVERLLQDIAKGRTAVEGKRRGSTGIANRVVMMLGVIFSFAVGTAPTWERFLCEALPDGDVRTFVQRFLGYCLTGSVQEQALLLAVGTGRNGKSTLFEAVTAALGRDFATPAPPGLLTLQKGERHPTELADLRGRRLVTVSEVQKSATFGGRR